METRRTKGRCYPTLQSSVISAALCEIPFMFSQVEPMFARRRGAAEN
jgi:hypothetical protein